MAISVIQRNSGIDTIFAGSCSAVFGSNNTGGNSIVVFGFAGANTTSLSTPTDTRGNTYNLIYNSASSYGIKIWQANNIGAGANTVSMGDGFNLASIHAYEITGLGTAPNFDVSAQTLNQNSATPSSASATTTKANEIILGGFISNATTGFDFTAGTGFSNIVTTKQNFFSAASEEKIVSSTGSYNVAANGNTNGNTWSVMVTFADSTTGGSPAANGDFFAFM